MTQEQGSAPVVKLDRQEEVEENDERFGSEMDVPILEKNDDQPVDRGEEPSVGPKDVGGEQRILMMAMMMITMMIVVEKIGQGCPVKKRRRILVTQGTRTKRSYRV